MSENGKDGMSDKVDTGGLQAFARDAILPLAVGVLITMISYSVWPGWSVRQENTIVLAVPVAAIAAVTWVVLGE